MEGKINIIHKNCDKSLAKDKSLPLNSYLVSYNSDDILMYDIAQGIPVDIFDHYYDHYRNLLSMEWTDGKVNPKFYGQQLVLKKGKK
jgi:hypothetical protein